MLKVKIFVTEPSAVKDPTVGSLLLLFFSIKVSEAKPSIKRLVGSELDTLACKFKSETKPLVDVS